MRIQTLILNMIVFFACLLLSPTLAFKYTFNNQTFEQVQITTYRSAYIEEYLSGKSDKFCHSWVILPGTSLISNSQLAVAYFMTMVYLFIGVIVIQGKIFDAVQTIISKKYMIIKRDRNNNQIELPCELWNPTVAQTTIISISTNVPILLINLIDTASSKINGQDELQIGIFTILGSSAFQFFFILGICYLSLSNTKIKRIQNLERFIITSVFSVFAYIWLYISLMVSTPGHITFPEAFFTVSLYFILILSLYIVDTLKNLKFSQYYDKLCLDLGKLKPEKLTYTQYEAFYHLQQILMEKSPLHIIDILVNDSNQIDEFEKERVKLLTLTAFDLDSVNDIRLDADLLDVLLQNLYQDSLDMIMHRMKFLNKICNNRNSFVQINKFYCLKYHDNEEIIQERPNPRIGFKSVKYTVSEDCGSFTVTICKKCKEEIVVGVRTVDGAAIANDDYVPINEIIKVSYLEYKLEIKIIDDVAFEPDEDFYIELFDPVTTKRLIGEDTRATVTILDEARPMVVGFMATQVKIHPEEKYASIKVLRQGHSDNKVSVFYCTEEIKDNINSAIENEDFEPIRKAELEFDKGEIEKVIEVKLVDKDDEEIEKEEIYLVFQVRLFDPQPEDVTLSLKDVCLIEISNEQNADVKDYKKVTNLLSYQLESQNMRTWSQQFKEACKLYPTVDQNGFIKDIPLSDCLLHLITIGWKVFISFIPPPTYYHGVPTLILSYTAMCAIVVVIKEFSILFACVVSIDPIIISITILTVGFNISEILILRRTAKKAAGERGADQTITQVLQNFCTNIYFGNGLAWLINVIFHGTTLGVPYQIDGDTIAYASFVLAIAIGIFLCIFMARRFAFKGELGGKYGVEKNIFGLLMILFWMLFVILLSLRCLKYI